MDTIKTPSTSHSNRVNESIENSSNEDVKKFLKTFANFLIPMRLSKHKIFKDICLNRNFLEILLNLNALDPTPDLITHLLLLLNYLSKFSSSTIFNSLRFYYANIELIQALLAIVDANAIKILMNNNNITSNCANEVINERLNEIESLKAKLRFYPLSNCTSINTSFRNTENFNKLHSPNFTKNNHTHSHSIIKVKPKSIECRTNTASILRTGAQVTKKLKYNEAIVEKIIAGGNNPFQLQLNKDTITKVAQKQYLDEIQRRHLLGLISSEEAKIAKIDAIKCKQKSAIELKKDKNRLRNLMNEEFERSVSKSKVIIRKIHLNRLILKRKKFDVVMKKKINADEVKRYHRKLQREIKVMREKEMKRKVKLIQKMKILEKKENLKGKSSNELLKMSIDELRASILNLQQQLSKERENRQRKIQEEHNRQKQLIQNTETLIEISRKLHRQRDQMKNEKGKWHSNVFVASNAPDLMLLREKLSRARKIVADYLST